MPLLGHSSFFCDVRDNWNAHDKQFILKRKLWLFQSLILFLACLFCQDQPSLRQQVYPNLNLGQYLTTGRFLFPVWMVVFGIEGFDGCGGFSFSLSVIVKPCSDFSCRFILGKKCVDTCCDFTLGLDPIFALPLLFSATNHSLPVRWFLWITEAYVLQLFS